MTNKIEWLDRGMIFTNVCYTLCVKEEDYHAILDDLGISRPDRPSFTYGGDASCHFFENLPDGTMDVCLVTIDRWQGVEPIVVAGLLVHEAVHLWHEALANMRETNPGREIEAYAIQWLSQQLMWSFMKQTAREG